MFGITRAPEIDRPGLVWFNTAEPLSLAALSGRIVLLDFWTFCCINCMHVLPTLRRIEDRFPTELAVIGVHSPKFPAERDPANVAHAIARYDIRHPVVHDPYMMLWEEYAVRAWPTLVFVSPDAHVIGQLSGEPDPDLLEQGVGDMVRDLTQRGELTPGALLRPERGGVGRRLAFPGKIKPLPGLPRRWAIADAGHHQMVLADDGGGELARYGSGVQGFRDGTAGEACFNAPQGLACAAEAIYVADTGNHALRRIDRATGMVSTLAGLGRRGPPLQAGAEARGAALASPWDLEVAGPMLYFANAGTHQIGVVDLASGKLFPIAGNGGEDIVDGPAAAAQLAQPSGLALSPDGRRLYFVDSETSALRYVELGERPSVHTLIGTGLFDFGHRNGRFAQAQLQHPLGLTALDGEIVLADSYNGRLRVADLGRRAVADLDPGLCSDPFCRPFAEPAGIAADGPGRLLLADTNNHRIVELDRGAGSYRTWMA